MVEVEQIYTDNLSAALELEWFELLSAALIALLKKIQIRAFVLEGMGGAGAFGWISGTTVDELGFSEYLQSDLPWVLPVAALCVGVWSFQTLQKAMGWQPDEYLLPWLRTFLLKVAGAGGAIHFSLTWFELLSTTAALGIACPPALLLWLPIAAAFAAAGIVYSGAEKGSWAETIHSFVTQVLGVGGATFWLLGFLAFAASATFPPLAILIVTGAVVLIAGAVWYRNRKAEAMQEEKTEKFATTTGFFPKLLNGFIYGNSDDKNNKNDQYEQEKITNKILEV